MKLIILFFTLATLSSCFHGRSHHGPKGHQAKMWKTLDTNSDGKVSKEEFTKGHESKFTEMDKDKDGFVTHDEKINFMKANHKGSTGESFCSKHKGSAGQHHGKSCDKKDCKHGKDCDKKSCKYGKDYKTSK